LDAYLEALRGSGFETCEDSTVEVGWEKAAIFVDESGTPTHATRQLPDGTWTSKLGKLEDIKHPQLNDVSGTPYGRPVVILRRPSARPGDAR
jgi:hypothetical protein